jgi:hypothetical protein
MSYIDKLRQLGETNPYECGLGKVLATEGREKYEAILDAIFAIDDDPTSRTYGKLFSIPRLEKVLAEDGYEWGEYFYRRHRHGQCKACLNRIETS